MFASFLFFLFQIRNTSKLAEVCKKSTLQLRKKLRDMKSQSESEEQKNESSNKKTENIFVR